MKMKNLLALALCASAPAFGVTVQVDGNPLMLDQPPIVETGRTMVPLRGIFEALGATVVYDAGAIRATAQDGNTIAMRVGARYANVGGRSVLLETPARVVGGRVLVPLRFIAESLGADVRWDAAQQLVSIQSDAPQTPVTTLPQPVVTTPAPAPISGPININSVTPFPGSIVGSLQPTLRVTFADAVRPESVRLVVDGRDLTSMAQITPHEVVWVPNYQLAAGSHQATVDAMTVGGMPVKNDWGWVLNPGTTTGYEIYNIQLGPPRPLARGEQLVVTMQGAPGGTAKMDVGPAKGLSMQEVRPGIYVGNYTVTERDQALARVIVTLTTADGRTLSLEAPDRAALQGNPGYQTLEP